MLILFLSKIAEWFTAALPGFIPNRPVIPGEVARHHARSSVNMLSTTIIESEEGPILSEILDLITALVFPEPPPALMP